MTIFLITLMGEFQLLKHSRRLWKEIKGQCFTKKASNKYNEIRLWHERKADGLPKKPKKIIMKSYNQNNSLWKGKIG